MTEHFQIVQLSPLHADVAAEIDKACFTSEIFDAAKIQTFLSYHTIFGLMAVLNEEPIGYALFQNVQDEGEVLTVGILPEHQGKGYGRKLLQAGLDELKSRQVFDVFLEVRRSNQTATGLYESFGGKAVGERPSYYEDGEDALVYKISF